MVSKAMRQIILIGVICFGTIGMYNAMSSIGNAGKHSPTAQNLVVLSSSIAYIVGFLVAGGLHNMLGPRPCVAFGGLTFVMYAGAMMLAKDNEHSIYPPLAGVLLGLGAGCIWVTQGAMMMSYPTEDNKGKYIACFWAIFNLGAVLGSIPPLLMNNAPGADPDDVSPNTYVVYMVIMGLATFLAVFLVRPSSIVRDDGEPVIVAKFAGIQSEFLAIMSVFCDWRMLLLIPAFFFSNFSYTYQFNDFNGFNFNIRTRSLNSILFWVAQIIGALLIGHLLDRLPMKRPKRALLGLVVIAVLFMATWVGALMMQIKHNWVRKTSINNSNLIDFEHGDSYPGPLAIYAMFGFCDAAFAVYCYWLMGALSNKHDELSRYAGFFKSIQSLGSAVAAPLDLAQTPLLAYLITNWILCAFSLAAMFLVCRTITDTTVEEDDDDYYDDDLDQQQYQQYQNEQRAPCDRDSCCGPSIDRAERGGRHLRPSRTHSSSFDGNSSTVYETSEGSKTACGSRSSEQRSVGCWRSSSRMHDFDDKDLELDDARCSSPPRIASPKSGLTSHDSYMSGATAVSSGSEKRRSSSVLSAASMTDRTRCPSPTFQHSQQNVRKSVSRVSRAPPMVEIQDDSSYLHQRHPQHHQHLSVPSVQGQSSRRPVMSLTAESSPSLRPGIEGSITSSEGHSFNHIGAMAASVASPASFLTTRPPQRSSYGVSSSGSTRYDEEQDMDSVDTCSLSTMSSGHDSIPEMSEMGPIPEPRSRRYR